MYKRISTRSKANKPLISPAASGLPFKVKPVIRERRIMLIKSSNIRTPIKNSASGFTSLL